MPDVTALALLLGRGTLVGLDLVSVPQAMIARPLVAGTVAGWIAGDTEAGLRVGLLLELLALDVLPVGASRYPDYGPATVGAAAFAAVAGGWESSLGIAAAIGVIVALVGDWSLFRLRHRIARDAGRSIALTALALALGVAATRWLALDMGTARMLSMVAIGCGLAAMVGGAIRSAGRGARVRWLAIGAGSGLALVLLR